MRIDFYLQQPAAALLRKFTRKVFSAHLIFIVVLRRIAISNWFSVEVTLKRSKTARWNVALVVYETNKIEYLVV